jgi:hypothetical protein
MADPREFGLTAADLRAAADLMYSRDDDRLAAMEWNHAAQVRTGRIRSRLRAMADAIEAQADLADDIATRGLDHWEGQHDDD